MNIIKSLPPSFPDNTYNLRNKFWSKVIIKSNDECWEWTDHKLWGYGYITINKRDRRAHRIAWELTYGDIPENMFVLHKCDNKACVNPNHLYLGTHTDNMKDVVTRKRNPGGKGLPAGENHPRAKLMDIDILNIRRDRLNKLSYKEITIKYNIERTTAWRIVNRKTRIDK